MKNRSVLVITLLFLLLAGCSTSNETISVQPTPWPSTTSEPTVTMKSTSTNIPTQDLSTLTSTPTKTIRPTPIPTLTLQSAEVAGTLAANMVDNPNCELPCLYGIIPGKATFKQAFTIMSALGEYQGAYYPGGIPGVSEDFEKYTFKIPLPQKYDGQDTAIYHFSVDRDLVAKVETQSVVFLSTILHELGKPTNIWVRLNISASEDGPPPFPFGIALFYEQLNLGVVYYVINGYPIGEKIQSCVNNQAEVIIGSEKIPITYESFEKISGYTTQPSLEEALGLDINSFYENYKDLSGEICFQTPFDIWSLPKR